MQTTTVDIGDDHVNTQLRTTYSEAGLCQAHSHKHSEDLILQRARFLASPSESGSCPDGVLR